MHSLVKGGYLQPSAQFNTINITLDAHSQILESFLLVFIFIISNLIEFLMLSLFFVLIVKSPTIITLYSLAHC